MAKYINPFTQYRMSDDWNDHLTRGSRGGIDYAMRIGTPITAPINGRVENRPMTNGFGNYVRLHHGDGWIDEFLHLNSFVAEGYYSQGQVIGYSGNTGQSTGPHLHWHLIAPNGTRVNPFDAVQVHADNAAQAAQAAQAAAAQAASLTKKVGEIKMIYVFCQENNITYIIGQQFISWPFSKDAPNLAKSFGDAKRYAKLADVIAVAKVFGVPEDRVRTVPASRYWSKLDTIGLGNGQTAQEVAAPAINVDAIAKAVEATLKDDFAGIPKAVNDDAAKRLND